MLGAFACWQWSANGCNNSIPPSHHCWSIKRVGPSREVIASLSPRRPCAKRVYGPNTVGRAVQTDPTMLRYASAITEQKKCWELLAQTFDRYQTLRKNSQQHATTYIQQGVQMNAKTNAMSCWPTILRPFTRSFRVSCRISLWWSRQEAPDMEVRSRDESDSSLQMRFASQVVCLPHRSLALVKDSLLASL